MSQAWYDRMWKCYWPSVKMLLVRKNLVALCFSFHKKILRLPFPSFFCQPLTIWTTFPINDLMISILLSLCIIFTFEISTIKSDKFYSSTPLNYLFVDQTILGFCDIRCSFQNLQNKSALISFLDNATDKNFVLHYLMKDNPKNYYSSRYSGTSLMRYYFCLL